MNTCMTFHRSENMDRDCIEASFRRQIAKGYGPTMAADFPPFHPVDLSHPVSSSSEINFTAHLLNLEEGHPLEFDSMEDTAHLIDVEDDHSLALESTDTADISSLASLHGSLLASRVQSPITVTPQLVSLLPMHLLWTPSSTRIPAYVPLSEPVPVHSTSLAKGQTPIVAPSSTTQCTKVSRPANDEVVSPALDSSGSNDRQYVVVDRERDILLGRGRRNQRNPGNIRYLKEVHRIAPEYHKASPHSASRTSLTRVLVERVYEYGGRFLEHDGNGWQEVDSYKAHVKACQSLRESKLTREERRAKAQRFAMSRRKKLEALASGFVSSDEIQPSTS